MEAATLGMPDIRVASVEHPIGHLDAASVRARGRAAGSEIFRLVTLRSEGQSEEAVVTDEVSAAVAEGVSSFSAVSVPADPHAMFDEFVNRGWSEGLPVVPPTLRRVEGALAYLGRDGEEPVGVVPPSWGVATVGAVVANGIMAGCRDSELPVVLAAVQGICAERFNLYGIQATTGSVAPLIVVSGPGAARLGIQGGAGCLGPGFRANTTIGRALRLVMWNVGGARPGELDRATHGQPGKYGVCLTENIDASPWPALHVEHGLASDDTGVYVTGYMGIEDVIDYASQSADQLLDVLSSCLSTLGSNHVLFGGWSTFLLSPEHANLLARAGLRRSGVAEALVRRATVDVTSMPKSAHDTIRRKRPHLFPSATASPDHVPVFDGPEHLQVIVAGGPGPHSVFLPSFGDLSDPQWVVVDWPTDTA